MASIQLSPILEHLPQNEVRTLEAALEEAGANPLDVDETAESLFLDSDLDEDLFAEILDRLELHDAACDIYVPPDFEEIFTIGDNRIGSAHMLLLVLEEMREELFVEEDEDEDDEDVGDVDDDYDYDLDDETLHADSDEEDPYELKDKQLQEIWRLMRTGAKMCIKHGVCMFIKQ